MLALLVTTSRADSVVVRVTCTLTRSESLPVSALTGSLAGVTGSGSYNTLGIPPASK